MDELNVNLVVGWIALVFGAFVGVLYIRLLATGHATSLLGKLGPMQQRFGRVPGTLLHFVAYCLLPIVVGVILITA